MTEKGTLSYLMKELLASAVLQMKAKAQWEVAGYSGQSQGLAQSTDAGGISLLLPSLSCVRTDRQTRGQSQLHKLQRGHKAAVGAGDSSWDGDVDPHRRLSHPLVVLAQSSSQGLFCHWRVIVKQRFGFCSSALPLLGNLSQCS